MHSSYSFVFPVSSKSAALDKFKIVQAYAERQTGRKVKAFRSDQGTEFLSSEFKEYLGEQGLTSLPKETQLFDTKFVFTRKPPPVLYKARLCFRGDKDKTELS